MNYELEQAMRKEEAQEEAAELLRGLTEEELMDILKGVFQNADAAKLQALRQALSFASLEKKGESVAHSG